MNPEFLFLNILNEIRGRIQSKNKYDHIKATALLRQLLNEGLVHHVAKNYNLKILFEVSNKKAADDLKKTLEEKGIRKKIIIMFLPFEKAGINEIINLEKFLKREILFTAHYSYTVKDVIRITANKSGGVHFDNNVNDKEKFFRMLESQVTSITLPSGKIILDSTNDAIISISRILLDALKPLEQAVINS